MNLQEEVIDRIVDISALNLITNEEFLTNREVEVVLEISEGLSNKEIGEKLCISL
ncbi:MAG: LuxR C-terminal-related transcriptional regulator [Clostridium sp.]|uniref:LuxR C-terminal-related transcriptional regulator n=1 Tax=Clostridium sp. TaxID=1506 RepID=UPI0039EB8DF1